MTQAFNLSQFANKLNSSGQTDNTGLQNSFVTVTAGTGMSGGGSVALGSSVTLTNAGVTSVTAGTGISVSASTGGVTISTSITNGEAKAWVNFNGLSGASPVIRSSFNVSSVTRNGTGWYTVAFSTTQSNANYSYVVSQNGNLNTSSNTFAYGVNINAENSGGNMAEVAPTISSFTFQTAIQSGNFDSKYVNVIVFGN